jgi:hypothetical protein
MTDIAPDTLKQIRAAQVLAWSHDQKIKYLKSRGWRRVVGNRWQSRDGATASLAHR